MSDFKPAYGLVPKTDDPRDLTVKALTKALGITLPPVSPAYGWGHTGTYSNWCMNGNGPLQPGETLPAAWKAAAEGAGDCVNSCACNECKVALTDAGMSPAAAHKKVGDAQTAIQLYQELTGYDPVTGANDEGTEIRARLKFMQKTGILLADGTRHKIGPFVAFDPHDLPTALFVVKHFEAVPIGCEVTEANEEAFQNGWAAGHQIVWDYVKGSPQAGLHCIVYAGRPTAHQWAGPNWSKNQHYTEAFNTHQVSEGWAYLTPDRLNKQGLTYEGDPEKTLTEYLSVVAKPGW
jgi:hypothetical protein